MFSIWFWISVGNNEQVIENESEEGTLNIWLGIS